LLDTAIESQLTEITQLFFGQTLTKQPSVLLPSNNETALANERAAELKLALEKEIAARQPRQIAEQRRPALKEALTKFLTRVK